MKKIFFLATILLSFMTLTSGSAVRAYSNSQLIDDAVFDNVSSWSEDRIRTFINSEHAGSCLQTSGAIFPEPIDYFTYKDGQSGRPNNPVDAARVIYLAAHYSDINPQVILATLQKEQSLITRTDCFERPSGIDTRNKAMGMGCPDSGPCPTAAYAGFHRQVMKGAWQLAFNRQRAVGNTGWGGNDSITYYGFMTQGNYKRCGSCQTIYYDGYATIDGQTVFMSNGPTASLYTYTPHLGQSFPGIFEGWFGPATLGLGPVYRMANFISKERLFTLSAAERDSIKGRNGWVYEGVAFSVPRENGIPVYRLANYITKERLFTMNAGERDSIKGRNGWVYEGVAFQVTN